MKYFSERKINVNPRSGFTLIELLVVIAIIGLLASVVMASLNSARAKARDATRVAQIAQFQRAIELYYDEHGDYPGTSSWQDNGCTTSYSDINPLMVGYMVLPPDPGSVCMYYTHNGAGGPPRWAYLIEFTPETPALVGKGTCGSEPGFTTTYCQGVR
jgi:prepilin-type N-terminal cleavage/methylation domain-containing protein